MKELNSDNIQVVQNRLIRLVSGLILLFVFSQTAGLLHAEIHPFHEHEASCDVFDNLTHPLDKVSYASFQITRPAPIIPLGIEARSVFHFVYQPYTFGRAPPIA